LRSSENGNEAKGDDNWSFHGSLRFDNGLGNWLLNNARRVRGVDGCSPGVRDASTAGPQA
jgi:hypothetical protein